MYEKGFPMLRSVRPGAAVVTLLIVVSIVSSAQAQTATQARPFFLTQSGGKKAVVGYTPAQIGHGYGFDQISGQGKGQTIAIVDAFDHPNIEQDLALFSSTFGLPACTKRNGCFQKVYASGSKPDTNSIWAFEISLDVEWVHAIAPKAKILLVEAASDQLSDLLAAVDIALASDLPTHDGLHELGASRATHGTHVARQSFRREERDILRFGRRFGSWCVLSCRIALCDGCRRHNIAVGQRSAIIKVRKPGPTRAAASVHWKWSRYIRVPFLSRIIRR